MKKIQTESNRACACDRWYATCSHHKMNSWWSSWYIFSKVLTIDTLGSWFFVCLFSCVFLTLYGFKTSDFICMILFGAGNKKYWHWKWEAKSTGAKDCWCYCWGQVIIMLYGFAQQCFICTNSRIHILLSCFVTVNFLFQSYWLVLEMDLGTWWESLMIISPLGPLIISR